MAVTTDQMYQVFQSIDASLKLLVAHFGCTAQRVGGPGAPFTPPRIASDADLDGKYGDPAIRAKDPRDWTGDSMLGRPYSDCPPEYLEMVADRLDYFNSLLGDSADDQKKRKYQSLDAARARGWAQRKRNGWQPPPEDSSSAFPSDNTPSPLTDDDVPF